MSVHPFSVLLQDYAISFQAIFVYLSRIMEYCCENNPFSWGVLILLEMVDWYLFWVFCAWH